MIVGYSLGGVIARELAANNPKITRAVFIASPLAGDGRIDVKIKADFEPLFQGIAPFID